MQCTQRVDPRPSDGAAPPTQPTRSAGTTRHTDDPRSATTAPPVIIGGGLTGMAISRALTEAHVHHVLIGPPPSATGPRLGESLNLEGSLDLERLFPNQRHHFYRKSAAILHVSDKVVRCDLDLTSGLTAQAVFRALGYAPPEAFWHVDRVRFDVEAFAEVIASPYCRYLDDVVTEVEYDGRRDVVESVTLAKGEELRRPEYVYDASNARAIVARAIGIERRTSGVPQRLEYGHWARSPDHDPAAIEPWYTSTHLTRMEADGDGVNGVAWLIPIGDRVSIGVSVDADDDLPPNLLDLARSALDRRGLGVRTAFPVCEGTATIPRMQHYRHARAYGKNWVLAGTTFRSVWFGTSSGVAMATAAARAAERLLRDPAATGERYQALQDSLDPSHDVFQWVRYAKRDELSAPVLHARATSLVIQSIYRLLRQTAARSSKIGRVLLDLFRFAAQRSGSDVTHICKLQHAAPEQQSDTLYADLEQSIAVARRSARRASIQTVLEVVAGHRPLADITTVMHRDVLFHMDWVQSRGLRAWSRWVCFMRSGAGLYDQRLTLQSLEPTYRGLRAWVVAEGVRDGVPVRSPALPFTYRFHGDKIAEVWTTRSNYEHYFGQRMRRPWGFVVELLRIELWYLTRKSRRAPSAEQAMVKN